LAIPSAQLLPILTLACCAGFPLIHFVYRWRADRTKLPTSGDITEKIVAGAGVPQALLLVLWPIDPGLLKLVTDLPILLIPTGLIALYFAASSLFTKAR
jgi:hypothetical protein